MIHYAGVTAYSEVQSDPSVAVDNRGSGGTGGRRGGARSLSRWCSPGWRSHNASCARVARRRGEGKHRGPPGLPLPRPDAPPTGGGSGGPPPAVGEPSILPTRDRGGEPSPSGLGSLWKSNQ